MDGKGLAEERLPETAAEGKKRRMTEVPKIVHHRLRAATPAREMLEQTHPEADLLTAIAEHALAAPEREGVLQHLALCEDCRDVVALALPEVDTVILPVEEKAEVAVAHAAAELVAEHGENRFSWASLGWRQLRGATLAAGIAVAVFVVRPALERIGMQHTSVNSAANQISPAAQPALGLQIASGALPENSAATKNAETGGEKSAAKKSANSLTADTMVADRK